MNIIFLDVDGVLNCAGSESRIGTFVGVDDDKIEVLKKICDELDAEIILCSSWKSGWSKEYKAGQDIYADYLDEKLADHGLKISDKTDDYGSNRGEGVSDWLAEHPEADNFIVIDNEIFDDYEDYGIPDHLLQTEFCSADGGLREEDVERAKNLVNKTRGKTK